MSSTPSSPPTILLIDDDAAVREGLAKLLQRHGFRVLPVPSGRRALRLLQGQPISLVITDIYMEEMDGLETIMCLEREHPGLPVIAISGGSPRMPVNCLGMARSLGARMALDKPVRIDSLMAAIRQLDLAPGGCARPAGGPAPAVSPAGSRGPCGDRRGPCS